MWSLFLLFCFSSFFGGSVQSTSNNAFYHQQQNALLDFKSLASYAAENTLADWSPNISICNWTGITCDIQRQRVLSLHLEDRHLQGTISPSLANIYFLQSISLSVNSLQGGIPPQLGSLFRLKQLSLRENQLEGFIPPSLANLSALKFLDLGVNNLQGAIPAELGKLNRLEELHINNNELTGRIPNFLLNLSSLTNLDISNNLLNNIIPTQFWLPRLRMLYLSNNLLTGPVPSSLSNCSSLQELALGGNQLEGEIPVDFGAKLTKLSHLSLWGNNLMGRIPDSIANCTKLTVLYLQKNKLSGCVPMVLGNLSLLQILDLGSNILVSDDNYSLPFLVGLSNCPQLQTISLDSNRLSGALPDTIGQLPPSLSSLNLSGNALGGNIPYDISNLTNLAILDLSVNRFSGRIPSLATLQNLQELHLQNNSFSGRIPSLAPLQNLKKLYVQNNRFNGTIPSLATLQNLKELYLQNNTLEGAIPDGFAKLKTLRFLDISHNKLAGRMPPSLRNCTDLQMLDLSYNALNGSIPREVAKLSNIDHYLNLSNNHLKGPLPQEIGSMVGAQAIDISGNLLNGFIPTTLGKCTSLQILNLSRNALDGIIPDSLGDLHNLMYMDLSRNNLEGEMPDSLGNLTILMHLDLSHNSLSGAMPVSLKKLTMLNYLNLSFNSLEGDVDRGVPENSNIVISFIGNSDLCGSSVAFLPACPSGKGHSAFLRKVLGAVGGVIAFIFFCLFLSFLWARKFKQQRLDLSQAIREILQNVEHPRISYDELFIATNGFDQANLLGASSFGSVYKGMLTDGTVVAVKVLNLNKQSEKSFKAECKVLQKVRHRNLARIITICSNFHFKSLVFEFLSNGSLDQHLYPAKGHVSELGLKELLNIAIDIADAVEYLHYDCYVQIVHCDIKPSNVLLDQDMTARLTDFGIARLMGDTSTDSLTSTINLKGSVGYIAPEYGLSGKISLRGDVYSYGILLLRMLTKKKPTDEMFEGDLNLHKWVNRAFPNQIAEVVDQRLLEQGRSREVKECVVSLLRIGLLCSKDSAEARPTMRDVSSLLKTVREEWEASTNSSKKIRPCMTDLLQDNSTMITVETSSDTQSSSTF